MYVESLEFNGSLREAARTWLSLADKEMRVDRAEAYRRCAEALKIQADTGMIVCPYCLKPLRLAYGHENGCFKTELKV